MKTLSPPRPRKYQVGATVRIRIHDIDGTYLAQVIANGDRLAVRVLEDDLWRGCELAKSQFRVVEVVEMGGQG